MTRAGLGLIVLWFVVGAGQAGAQTIGYAEAIDLLSANCGKDIATYCGQANLGGGRVQSCLAQNQARISARCKAASVEVVALIRKREAARQAVLKVCERDIGRLCSGVVAGDGNLLGCFLKAEARANAECRQAVTDAGYR
jgi:OOP family OmpA-OmpF porin